MSIPVGKGGGLIVPATYTTQNFTQKIEFSVAKATLHSQMSVTKTSHPFRINFSSSPPPSTDHQLSPFTLHFATSKLFSLFFLHLNVNENAKEKLSSSFGVKKSKLTQLELVSKQLVQDNILLFIFVWLEKMSNFASIVKPFQAVFWIVSKRFRFRKSTTRTPPTHRNFFRHFQRS